MSDSDRARLPSSLGLAGGLASAMAGLCLAAALEGGPFPDGVLWLGAGLYGALALAVGVAWRSGRPRVHRGLLFLVWVVFASELGLQALSLGGCVPGAKVACHSPLGRVYWTFEGRNSGRMNLWGWHADRRTFEGDGPRVVLIGDSFVEALEVSRSEATGPRLEAELADGTQVVPLGRGATGPGHYLETLDYALERHGPDRVVVAFFLGNDFTDSMGQGAPPDQLPHELLYALDAQGRLELHPSTVLQPQRYRHQLVYNHYATPLTVARSLLSHHLLLGLGQQLATSGLGALAPPPPVVGAELPRERVSDPARLALVLALFAEMKSRADAARVALQVVTIPHFPAPLYAQPADQVAALDGYGLLEDERLLAEGLQRLGLPTLRLGRSLREDRRTVSEIEGLFIGGVGHFTPAGHAWFASELAAAIRGDRG